MYYIIFDRTAFFKCLTLLTVLDLQVGFLKHLGDVASVLINLVLSQFVSVSSCDSRQTDDDQITSQRSTGCCQTTCANKNLTGK